ncbi:hypothetical protein BJ875DRAFT_544641 [Amylocarpus encephaloides]|uniref:Uncharacterized protein n=1 Tax=Amylocarpus encephaloides TaxID=45428 RepID=A0A9P7YES7_9HELO|nr:hypothetical protein BJ875DRAFT_544641 [Amylocarpus encephaloides]
MDSQSIAHKTKMDEFAQSREDDDLFADEFEPLPEPTTTVDDTKPTPHSHSHSADTSNVRSGAPDGPRGHRNNRGQGQGRGRGRGGGGGGAGQNNGLSQSKYAPTPESGSTSAPPPTEAPPSELQDTTVAAETQAESTQPTTTETTPQPQIPTQPISIRTPAVRGDRSATGGPAHKKLTEEELTLKLAQMAILNAEKTEKHRLQEADQAAFQHREKELAKERREKQVVEKKNSRQMEMERAKNRQRKINAQGGREWDSEKVESDIVDGRGRGRSSGYVRGGHGGVIRGNGLAGSKFAEEGDGSPGEGDGNSRGHGGFEIRGSGRGGRGARGGNRSAPITKPAGDWYGSDEIFPSLPTPTSKPDKPDSKTEVAVKSPTLDQPAGEWAEEMATPVEEKHGL